MQNKPSFILIYITTVKEKGQKSEPFFIHIPAKDKQKVCIILTSFARSRDADPLPIRIDGSDGNFVFCVRQQRLKQKSVLSPRHHDLDGQKTETIKLND